MRTAVARGRLAARRVGQTPTTFVNWRALLGGMALETVGRGPETLTFRTRTGLTLYSPNRPGARVPVYEIFAEDAYRLAWTLGPLIERPVGVLDIGGHIGTFAMRLAQLHPTAQITSYEPSPTTAGYLRRNVAANGFGDRAHVVQAAVSETRGRAAFSDNGAGSGENGLVAVVPSTTAPTEVRTVTFADAVADAKTAIDLVKIDCEGGEYAIVLGSEPQDWSSVSRVVMEFHPVPGHSWDELRTRFEAWGFAVQHVQTQNGYGCAWLSRSPLPPFPH